MASEPWVGKVEGLIRGFARRYRHVYSRTKRELYAAFEVGCYLALLERYENDRFQCSIEGLTKDGSFRFLTTPSGNPNNFSYVRLFRGAETAQLRQQVRVRSHIDPDIAFTPDIVVLRPETVVDSELDADYARGKRRFFSVSSGQVIAAHECKSLVPFPELLVSFLGMLLAAHAWLREPNDRSAVCPKGPHLAPTLFVGGEARPLHLRMIRALQSNYPINVVLGLHFGTWKLSGKSAELTFIDVPHRPKGK